MRKERNLNDRIRGALIGGAVGDALGYPVEFMTYDSMVQAYGKNGITRFELTRGIAEFSDDTQMTLFTANGLLNGIIRNRRFHKDTPLADYVSSAYADWYGTQLRQGRMIPENERDCWLDSVPQLYSLRAPGNTCLSAIEQRRCGMEVCNHSKGCGGIMRVAPVGWAFNTVDDVLREAADSAACSHDHPHGIAIAQGTALAVFLARKGQDKDEIRRALEERFGWDLGGDLAAARAQAAVDGFDETWRSVPLALRVFLNTDSFEDCLVQAIALGCDADTQACIACAVAEAFYGPDEALLPQVRQFLPKPLDNILKSFCERFGV